MYIVFPDHTDGETDKQTCEIALESFGVVGME